MEDFIYLIILIAWAVFAFYRQSQKKKAAAREAETKQAAPQPESQGKNWEEILFGEGSTEEFEPEEEPLEETTVWTAPKTSEPVSLEQMYMQRKIESLEDLRVQQEMDMEKKILLEEEDQESDPAEQDEHWFNDFDLRKAVIYSEILRRPYD